MMDESVEATEFPLVQFVHGGPSQDGRSLLVEAATTQGPVQFSVALADVKHLVAFLLVSVGKMTALAPAQPDLAPSNPDCRPIPATSISIGEADGDQGYLGIDVGAAELVFSLPLSAFDPIARTMLATSAQPKRGFVT
jgi:hypothetical protein